MSPEATRVVTLTLNPAIDQTVTLDRLVPGAVHRARAVRSNAGGDSCFRRSMTRSP